MQVEKSSSQVSRRDIRNWRENFRQSSGSAALTFGYWSFLKSRGGFSACCFVFVWFIVITNDPYYLIASVHAKRH